MSIVEAGQPYHYKGVYFTSTLFPRSTLEHLDNFEIRDDDIFVVTYPRSGTTLSQHIVRLVMNHGDLESTVKTNLHDMFPFLEVSRPNKDKPNFMYLDSMRSPRLIKTHLPLELIPKQVFEKKPKILYVVRNPKDVAVSNFNFNEVFGTDDTFGDFLEDFMEGEVTFGSWFDHTKGWLRHSQDEHVMVLRFEDIIQDLNGNISKIANFLLPTMLSSKKLEEITELCGFDKMRDNPQLNKRAISESTPLLRKGVVGDWRNVFTVAQSERLDELYKKRMEGVDINFKPAKLQ
ncbi:sulfotransferase 1C2-like isoform X1 [Glandiceps talaboti]